MLQRRPRPRPGHALKKLASPRPCTFQSVDGGRRVCGGLLRPSRRTPPRKGRVPKPSARDAPSAVCDPIDTHSSHVCAAADRRCARTPSGDCLNRRRRWPRAGFCAGRAAVSSCAFQQASAREQPPTRRSFAPPTSPQGGGRLRSNPRAWRAPPPCGEVGRPLRLPGGGKGQRKAKGWRVLYDAAALPVVSGCDPPWGPPSGEAGIALGSVGR